MQDVLVKSLNLNIKYKDSKQNQQNKDYSSSWEKYKFNVYEYMFYRTLGENIPENTNVLDVGCGNLMTTQVLFENLKNTVYYTTIDKDVYPRSILQKMVFDDSISQIDHHIVNVFETDPDTYLSKKYDILIIDIEPHGKEIEVYEKFKKFMNTEHLLILKHVASLSIYGSQLADKFITKYFDEIKDYFAEASIRFDTTRDVFIIFGKDQNIQAQKLAKGKLSEWYRDGDGEPVDYKSYVLSND